MKTVKTARGKTLNMGQLAEEFERTRAVSNVPVNAKGDIIDARGDVKVPREKISKEYYRDNLQGVEESVSIKVDDDGYPINLKEFDKVDIDPDKIDNDIVLPSGSPLSYRDIFDEVKKREVEADRVELYTESYAINYEKGNLKELDKFIKSSKLSRSLQGLSRTLVANMVTGVSSGFEKRLQITGVGYRAQLAGNDLVLNMGYSHPVKMITPATLSVKVENPTSVVVCGLESTATAPANRTRTSATTSG